MFAARGGAQDSTTRVPTYRYRILGVYDERTGVPVENADVIDVLNGNRVRTTSTGTASLLFLPDGGALVRVQKIGYELQTMMISISPGDTNPLTLLMKRVVELAPMSVVDSAPRYNSPTLKNFEDRRRNHSAGYFIAEADIRKEGNRSLADVLRARVPNVQISLGSSGAELLERPQHCGAGYPPDVYLDGVQLPHPIPHPNAKERRVDPKTQPLPEMQPMNLRDFSLEELAGIEYYATTSTAPVEFSRTSAACGVLLLWTRER